MQLEELDNLDQLEQGILDRLYAVRIYYCRSSRNAWQGKIERYRPGCMHTNMETAKGFAEAQRVQGSVFYIRQLPALLLVDGPHLVVTQINTNEPLHGYSSSAVGDPEVYSFVDDSLIPGNGMREVVDSFRYNSPFWTTAPKPRDSVMRLFYDDELDEFEDLNHRPLMTWKSRSTGGDQTLKWDPVRTATKGEAVLRLAR